MFRLYHQTATRWDQKPPFGELFFDNLSRLEPGYVQLWVTRIEGQMASGVVIFTYGAHQTPYLGGFDREYTGYDPNNLMYAEAMKWGARQGLRYCNFLSSAGITYFLALEIEQNTTPRKRKTLFLLGIGLDVGALLFFKYAAFSFTFSGTAPLGGPHSDVTANSPDSRTFSRTLLVFIMPNPLL